MIEARDPSPQSPMRVRLLIAGALVALAAAFLAVRPAAAVPISQIATYPANNASRVAPEAELYFVFDQPTAKSGGFSVADLDSGGGTLLSLLSPRWSALGDTVFLKPAQPMQFGHLHGMRVNTINAPDPQNSSVDLPIVYFTVSPRAHVERVGNQGTFESVSLVPGQASPVSIGVRETAGTAATFTSARYRFYPSDEVDLKGAFSIVPTGYTDVPYYASVPRKGTAALTVPVTLSRQDAALAADGVVGLELVFDGYDETGLPYTFSASSRIRTNTFPGDSTLILTRTQITPALGANIGIGSVFLESPLPGTVYAVGDTLRPRAVVTGIGTGPYRGAFYMDGEFVALVEGFLESGRPDTVTVPGPLPTRRQGEHRLQFVVESPQNVPSSPITILCVAPDEKDESKYKLRLRNGKTGDATSGVAVDFGTLAQAKTKFGPTDGSATYWSRTTAFTNVGAGARLEADALWRLRLDDTQNGAGTPERMMVRLKGTRGTVEWGDLAPTLANGSPLLASAVPRRAAQMTMSAGGLGTLEGYAALESHPRSAGGIADDARSDLYAGRLSHEFGARLRLTAYGGYTHEDPTADGVETATRARGIVGGTGTLALGGGWRWLGDVATVRHRTIEGVEPGRSRTGVRTEVAGRVRGADLRAEGFIYQPDLQTELNPYALSDRQGVTLSAKRTILDKFRLFGDYRFEEPNERIGPVQTPFGAYGGVPYVSVQRLALGSGISLNQSSSVTPIFIRVHHRGVQTDLIENRLSSEFTTAEANEGRTSVKFEVAGFVDNLGVGKKRKLIAGTFVSTRRHPGGITTTTIVGGESDKHVDLNLSDNTIQGSFEARWDAKPSRFAVIPYAVYTNRDLETTGVQEEIISGRLQLMAMQLAPIRGATIALEGRIGRVARKKPIDDTTTDYGATFTLSAGGATPTLR